MKIKKLLKIKQNKLKNLEEIFINTEKVFNYFRIEIEKNEIEKLLNEIQILKNEIKNLEYEELKNQTSIHNQSISDFSKKDQEKLIRLLDKIKNTKTDFSSNEHYQLNIDEEIISIYYFNGWEEVKAKIIYENLKDIESYKLASYYYQYDYSSDPPFESQPPELIGSIIEVFNYIFEIYDEYL